MAKVWFWSIALSVLEFSSVVAQEKQSYSLTEAIELALKNNPAILVAEEEVKSAKGKKLQAFAPEKPRLGFTWEGIESGLPLSEANERTIRLEQVLEFPHKYFLKKGITSHEADITVEKANRVRALVKAEVKRGYYKLKFQQKVLETLESNLGLLKQFQEATLVKYQSGGLPYFEVVRAKVEIAKTQNELLSVRKELGSDKVEFNLLLGNYGAQDFVLEDELNYIPFEKTKEGVLQELTNQSKTLKIARLKRERESKSLTLAKSSLLPDFTFSGGYFSESGGEFSPSFEVAFSLPLWWWNPKGQILENRANLNIAKTEEIALERIIRGQIEKNYELLNASEEQVVLFEKTLLREVDEELKAGLNSYQYNQIDALGLLDIYRTNKATKTEYFKALYNYLSAVADLEVAGEVAQ